jgi:AraC-like DNA-binding protein
MVLAAFVPALAVQVLRKLASDHTLVLAQSWDELEHIARVEAAGVLVLDPTADGTMNCSAVIRLMRSFPTTPTLAFVTLTGQNLRAVVKLSRHGLGDAVLHSPSDQAQFQRALDRARTLSYTRELLGWLERPLSILPPSVRRTLLDVFQRPYRYGTAADIAIQEGVSTKSLSRMFRNAELGSPKRFLIVAKLFRGYSCLRESGLSAGQAAAKIGCAHTSSFTKYCVEVFGCTSSALARESNREEVIKALLEWIYKPIRQEQHHARALTAAATPGW